MPEAFVDYNENGIWDANEPYFDFNGNGVYDAADGKYNGVLCTPGAAICSAQKSIDVRGSEIIIFSSSTATVAVDNNVGLVALPTCVAPSGVTPAPHTVTVVDVNGNAMPAGTTVTFTSDNAVIVPASFTVPDTIGCRTANPVTGGAYTCPASVGSATFGDIPLSIKSNATYDSATGLCKDTGASGTFTVTVTSPKGLVTTKSITITD
jgi:hypothetical protein